MTAKFKSRLKKFIWVIQFTYILSLKMIWWHQGVRFGWPDSHNFIDFKLHVPLRPYHMWCPQFLLLRWRNSDLKNKFFRLHWRSKWRVIQKGKSQSGRLYNKIRHLCIYQRKCLSQHFKKISIWLFKKRRFRVWHYIH